MVLIIPDGSVELPPKTSGEPRDAREIPKNAAHGLPWCGVVIRNTFPKMVDARLSDWPARCTYIYCFLVPQLIKLRRIMRNLYRFTSGEHLQQCRVDLAIATITVKSGVVVCQNFTRKEMNPWRPSKKFKWEFKEIF